MAIYARRVRQQVLDRDKRECQLKLYGCTHNANDIYLQNPKPGRDMDTDMFIAVCPPCLATMTMKRATGNKTAGDRLRNQRITTTTRIYADDVE